MTVIDRLRKIGEVKSMLTPLIEENKITLIHSESGSGKTMFSIEHLNQHSITPILIDFDDNEQDELNILNLKADLLDGEKVMELLLSNNEIEKNNLLSELKNKVVIIDTWTLFCAEFSNVDTTLNLQEYAKEFCDELTSYSITVILLSHTNLFSGKEHMPDVLDKVYRHIKGRLYIRKTSLKNEIQFDLIVEKIRGYKGERIIRLREDNEVKIPSFINKGL